MRILYKKGFEKDLDLILNPEKIEDFDWILNPIPDQDLGFDFKSNLLGFSLPLREKHWES